MSKMDAIRQQLKRADPIPPAKGDATASDLAPRSSQAPSRDGKVNISAFLDPAYKRSLRMVQAKTEKNITELLEEALNELFHKHGAPLIDR